MKKHSSSLLTRNLRRGAFVLSVCASLFGSLSANATFIEDKPSMRVQRSAAINGQPVFQVALSDAQHQGFALRISDESGNLLYSEKINAGAYSKRFQLATGAAEDVRVFVELVSKDGQKSESYLVQGNSAAAQELVVSRF
ncbi:MAG: hypothetical protein EOO16_06350 [Chitinophagaceae bacterium]|nr:MAG: hypothetical protein EOO16_06350 [Chitinophagaceae bacterium]